MKILWICGLPREVQESVAGLNDLGAQVAWSWIVGHLPPPDGVELHIACPITRGPWRNRRIEYQGATFHLIRFLPGRLKTLFFIDPMMYRRLAIQIKPDIIHGWGTEDSHSISALRLSPKAHVVQVQGLINAYLPYLGNSQLIRYVAWRERRTLKAARHVFVESEYSRSISEPYCGPNTAIIRVDHPLRARFLEEDPAPETHPQILFIGTLDSRKGYTDAVEAFSRSAPEPWRLVLIGRGTDDRVRALRELISGRGLDARIDHLPQASVDKVIEYMSKASVFLLPSYMDTGPTALKEALAMGLWPVCYDNSGPSEYINRYAYGSLAPTGGVDQLSVVLGGVLKTRPWEEANRKALTVQSVRHDLCAKTVWARLLNLYRGVLTSSTSP